MSYARRTDANHAGIIAALRRFGWYVHDTSRVGGGFPDCVAVRAGRVRFIEIKDGSKSPSRRTLTRDEQALHEAFRVAGVDIVVVSAMDEVTQL